MSVKSICVFASGGGSHLKSIHQATLQKQLNAKIDLIVSDKPDSGAVSYANKHNIEVFLTKNILDDAQSLLSRLLELNVEFLILAGFIKKIPIQIIEQYKDKIFNIHPSLLPKYGGKGMYGLNVHKAVLENHETHTGCTVHKVNEYYDEGDILAQHQVIIPKKIKDPQELSDFLKPIENQFYVSFLKQALK